MTTTSADKFTSTPALRAANAGDRVAIERLLADSGLPVDGVRELLETRAQDFLVADDPESANELVAVGGLEVCCNDALLRSVAVRPQWRTRGLGRALVERLVNDAEARGIRALYLLTTTAERYFPRFGFTPVARDAVPAEVRETVEFRSACPASAVAMTRPSGARVAATT